MKTHAMSPDEALAALRAGNERYVHNLRTTNAVADQAKRLSLLDGQSPFATILSCSDSRVPSELVFDCGLGDLFVVRVAGNVVAPSLIGSVEFAAVTFGTPLAVVMGHSRCGAVGATLDALMGAAGAPSTNVGDIVDRITPAVAELIRPGAQKAEIMPAAVRANVRASVSHLRHGSRVLEERVSAGLLLVVGAEYSLETGEVTFFC